MYAIDATIAGVAPVLFNGWSEDALRKLDTGVTGGKRTIDQKVSDAWQRLYRNDQGVYVPKWTIKKMLSEACSMGNFKEGKKSLAPYITATVFLDDDAYFVDPEVFMHEVWGRVPPRTGAAQIIRRPAVSSWTLQFRLNVMDDRRDANRLKEVLETAGLLVGLGSWRPEYGRFIVKEWAVMH